MRPPGTAVFFLERPSAKNKKCGASSTEGRTAVHIHIKDGNDVGWSEERETVVAGHDPETMTRLTAIRPYHGAAMIREDEEVRDAVFRQ